LGAPEFTWFCGGNVKEGDGGVKLAEILTDQPVEHLDKLASSPLLWLNSNGERLAVSE
jgi:hypothetical protein